MTERPLYLDHNATTPVLPEVIEVMVRALREGWGNPGSDHAYGRRARAMVEEARAHLAALLGAEPHEIVFVSGGTEACDLALHGTADAAAPGAIVTSAIEHPAILETAEALVRERPGWSLEVLPVGQDGRVRVPQALPEDARLLTVMLANNETGVIQPVRALAALARQRGAWVHTDASQAVGKIEVDVGALDVDLLTVAGHKLYAPKGIGALYVRAGTALSPRLRGGGQQRGLRPGTEPVPAIAALGEAARLARADLERESQRQRILRDALAARLREAIPGLAVTAEGAERLPNTLHVRFPGALGRAVLAGTSIAASTGAACHSGVDRPSRVLLAMGLAQQDALGAVRLSLGRSTTEADVQRAVDELAAGWRQATASRGGQP